MGNANRLTMQATLGRVMLCLGVFVAGVLLLPAPLQSAPATADQVDLAIKRAVDYLYSRQAKGTWETAEKRDPTTRAAETHGGQWGGRTAIATYALLAAEQSPQDPRLAPAIAFLRRSELVGTYAIGLRAQVWTFLAKNAENRNAAQRDATLLIDLAKTEGDAKGFYSYLQDKRNDYDHSCSQYGVLGAWACAQVLPEFPPGYWNVIDQAWRRQQHDSGGWSYNKDTSAKSPDTITMTCGGVATLFITQDFLNRTRPAETNGNLKDENIAKGLDWISKNFNAVISRNIYYALYGVERVGVASGYKYFDTVNWYQTGADFLVSRQRRDGSWGDVPDTSFAMLFLTRGRAPITMNKLQYDVNGKEARWNQRPRDLANLTKYIAKETERDLNWQIVNLKAPVDELHDAPILYLAGDQELELNDEQKQKLRTFAEQGGMILAHADGSSLKFAKSARTLGSKLFPQYEFRNMPADHPIFTAQQYPAAKWKKKPNVLGLSNGARELMVLLPDDPAKYWHPYDVRRRVEDFQLGANIFLYAVDKKNLRRKGETYLVTPDPNLKPTKTITLARLQYDSNWNPEPGGWKRLAAIFNNTHRTELKVETIKLGSGKLKGMKIAHLTGTTQFKLDDAARKEIKEFIDAGGTLIVDAAGGNGAFATSAETELQTIFGDDAKTLAEPLPQDSPVYRAGGKAIDIQWRMYAKSIVGTLKGGRLRAVKIKDRLAVIFSAEDLSVGLVGHPIDGINGYEPKTASALMANAILQAGNPADAIKK